MNLYGKKVVIVPPTPRYTLPEELIPGVPWNPEFRREINEWSKNFLGYSTPLIDKEVWAIADTLYMSEETYRQLRGIEGYRYKHVT